MSHCMLTRRLLFVENTIFSISIKGNNKLNKEMLDIDLGIFSYNTVLITYNFIPPQMLYADIVKFDFQ
jgi:hypothetical protein